MKQILKILGAAIIVILLCTGALIGLVEFTTARSKRQVESIVSELAPGTPLSSAVSRLGNPVRKLTDPAEIEVFTPHPRPGVDTDTTLYLFTHVGPPIRWVLVYTPKGSEIIQYAGWQEM